MSTLKFTNPVNAENYRNRAAERFMISKMEGSLLVTTRRETAKLKKQGYEVY